MKRIFSGVCVRALALLAAVVLCSVNAGAQERGTVSWTKLPGTAVDLSINRDGQAYAAALDGTPWRWDALEQRWRRMSGKFVRITAAVGNRPWAVNADGVVLRYNGLWWENKDTGVADVAADALGNVYIAKVNGDIKKWNPLRSEWQPMDGTAKRIALDSAGNPWVVTGDERVRSFDGKTWTTLPGRAVDIAVGGDDTVVIVDADGRVRTWSAPQRRWQVVGGVEGVLAVAAAPDGGPWAALREGAIMATTLLVAPEQIKTEEGKAKQIQAPTDHAPVDSAPVAAAASAQAAPVTAPAATATASTAPAAAAPAPVAQVVTAPPAASTVTTTGEAAAEPSAVAPATAAAASTDPVATPFKGNITFVNTLKSAASLAIGRDGSVFGLDAGGNVLRWSNARKRFESFPGTLVRIAVDPEGKPWGISALGRVFRHTGELWKQIPNATASDIAISSEGAVIITNAAGRLFKLNSAMTRFEPISGSGLLVAVAPDGVPWTVRSDNLVQRCDALPCTVFAQKANNIAIGPDGSVWIVSDRSRLMRLNADGKTFGPVLTPGHTPVAVAVGPNGYPWVVSDAKIALASTFFQRDETQDRTTAAATAGNTVGTGQTEAVVDVPSDTSFTFSKNMTFETYATDVAMFNGFAIGENGKVYAWGDPGDQITPIVFRVFNSNKKVFEAATFSFPQTIDKMDAASDGTVWGAASGSVYKLSAAGALLKTYTLPTGFIQSLAIGADGTVYVVVGSLLYRLKPGTSVFAKFSNDDVRKVAVGRANDLWITDSNYIVQQYTGSKFENRPLGQSVSAENIGASSNGSVYIAQWTGVAYQLKKWNATNKSFDAVNNAEADMVDVDPDGRPWFAYTSMNNDLNRAKD